MAVRHHNGNYHAVANSIRELRDMNNHLVREVGSYRLPLIDVDITFPTDGIYQLWQSLPRDLNNRFNFLVYQGPASTPHPRRVYTWGKYDLFLSKYAVFGVGDMGKKQPPFWFRSTFMKVEMAEDPVAMKIASDTAIATPTHMYVVTVTHHAMVLACNH